MSGPTLFAAGPRELPRDGARRVVASSGLLVAESLVRLGITAAISFWIARELGAAQFGMLNLASALMVIFYVAAGMGLEVPTVLRLARDEPTGRVLGTALALRTLASLVACAACAVAATLTQAEPLAQGVSLIVALAILGYAPAGFEHWFKARVQAGPVAFARLSTTLASAALKVAVLTGGGGVVALAWTVAAEALLHSLLLFAAWRRFARSRRDRLVVDTQLAGPLFRQGLPFLGASLAAMLATKADLVLLGMLASPTQAGLYALAQKLTEVVTLVPIVLVDSAYPLLLRRIGEGRARDSQLLFDIAAGSGLLAAGLAVTAGAWLVTAVFGDGYAGTVPLVMLHSWTCVAIALDAARQRCLGAAGLQRHAPWLAALGAAVSISLALVLVPRLGATGAALTALVASFASAVLASFALPALRPIAWMQLRALWPWFRLAAALRASSRGRPGQRPGEAST